LVAPDVKEPLVSPSFHHREPRSLQHPLSEQRGLPTKEDGDESRQRWMQEDTAIAESNV
jgi:hypothetical protein